MNSVSISPTASDTTRNLFKIRSKALVLQPLTNRGTENVVNRSSETHNVLESFD